MDPGGSLFPKQVICLKSGSKYLICRAVWSLEQKWRPFRRLITRTTAGLGEVPRLRHSLRCLCRRACRCPASPPPPGWCGRGFSLSREWRRAGSPALMPSARCHRAWLWTPAQGDLCWWGLAQRAAAGLLQCSFPPPHHHPLHLLLRPPCRCSLTSLFWREPASRCRLMAVWHPSTLYFPCPRHHSSFRVRRERRTTLRHPERRPRGQRRSSCPGWSSRLGGLASSLMEAVGPGEGRRQTRRCDCKRGGNRRNMEGGWWKKIKTERSKDTL